VLGLRAWIHVGHGIHAAVAVRVEASVPAADAVIVHLAGVAVAVGRLTLHPAFVGGSELDLSRWSAPSNEIQESRLEIRVE